MVDLKALTVVDPDMMRSGAASHYLDMPAQKMAAPIRAKLDRVTEAYGMLGLDPKSPLSNEALTEHIGKLTETPEILGAKKLLLDDKHNQFFSGLVEQGALDRSEKLKGYFSEYEHSGGWRDTRFSRSRRREVPANPSFPLDHLSPQQQEHLVAGLKDEFQHSGFVVEVAHSSTTGYKSVYITPPPGSDRIIDGNTITKRMAERLEKGVSTAAAAEKESFDAMQKMFEAPVVAQPVPEPLPLTPDPAGTPRPKVVAQPVPEPLPLTPDPVVAKRVPTAKPVVGAVEGEVVALERTATRTAAGVERSGMAAVSNMERQAVNAVEHNASRFGKYALLAGAAVVGTMAAMSFFRKKPEAQQEQAPSMRPPQAAAYQFDNGNDYGLTNGENWTSRVQANRGMTVER